MDVDLLTMLSKRYDPVLRMLRNHSADGLFKITIEVIREVFMLSPYTTLHEEISFEKLQANYNAKRVYLKSGPL